MANLVQMFTQRLKHQPITKADIINSCYQKQPAGSPMQCSEHDSERCEIYCDSCRVPLCTDCIISLSHGAHRNHHLQKIPAVLTQLKAEAENVITVGTKIKQLASERLHSLSGELSSLREEMVSRAKEKARQAHEKTDLWLQCTLECIATAFDDIDCQMRTAESAILNQNGVEVAVKLLGEVERGSVKVADAQRVLETVQAELDEVTTGLWPPSRWTVQREPIPPGAPEEDVFLDMGEVCLPAIRLPDCDSWQTAVPKAPYIVPLYGDCLALMKPHRVFGFSESEALVQHEEGGVVKKIAFVQKDNTDGESNTLEVVGSIVPPLNLYKMFLLSDGYTLATSWRMEPNVNDRHYVYDRNLRLSKTLRGYDGVVIGAHSRQWVAFMSKDGLAMRAYNTVTGRCVQTLPLTGKHLWSVKAVWNPATGQTALVDANLMRLEIYSPPGGDTAADKPSHVHTTDYPIYDAAANSQYVCVRSLAGRTASPHYSVDVYSWQQGALLCRLVDQLTVGPGHTVHSYHQSLGDQQLDIPDRVDTGRLALYDMHVTEDRLTVLAGDEGGTKYVIRTFLCV